MPKPFIYKALPVAARKWRGIRRLGTMTTSMANACLRIRVEMPRFSWIGRGTMSGREVFFEIALIPVALAFGATLIGLAWVIFG